MHAACQHDARDRMVNPAKCLHRRRRQSDLVARGVAVLAAEQAYILLLDIIGVRDRGRRRWRTKRLEPSIGLVFREQRFGCAPGRDILHGASPFSQILARHRLRSNTLREGRAVQDCAGVIHAIS